MPKRTSIEWADFSSNPLRAELNGKLGWSCEMISPGCANCYARTLNGRFGTRLNYTPRDNAKVNHILDQKELEHILRFRPRGPFRGTTKPKVFVCDMTDLFGEWESDETLDHLFAAFALRPDVIFQVLTKRAKRACKYLTAAGKSKRILYASRELPFDLDCQSTRLPIIDRHPWPLPNVWLGVSAEDQKRFDERWPLLRATPAAVRFISYEPALGPLKLPTYNSHTYGSLAQIRAHSAGCKEAIEIDWIIAGGESGSGARACNVEWIRSIVAQCAAAGVPCFVKQDSAPRPGQQGRIPDELWIKEFPCATH